MSCCSTHRIKRLQAVELLARIVGWNAAALISTDISEITYSAYIFHEATGEEVETTYLNEPLDPVGDFLEDTLLTGEKWTEDSTGYNFHFTPPGAIFDERQVYLIRVTFTPTDVDLEPIQTIFYLEVD